MTVSNAFIASLGVAARVQIRRVTENKACSVNGDEPVAQLKNPVAEKNCKTQ